VRKAQFWKAAEPVAAKVASARLKSASCFGAGFFLAGFCTAVIAANSAKTSIISVVFISQSEGYAFAALH
jgi:hypothetical protein